ncbi:ABC-type antimicrobial peptide transport system, permease component [Nostoc sp. PCC 7524]|uniref:ABC transporter permease n=1 Tax=Nostoc sp. (strain ATCC 29411 / PCC 7524) TaxID=28072 RepID=UPI00029EDC31|nr:ABC-type antimicrobial peptide transport system, permease component [Nostoc sp. PCC 7524]
MRTFDYFKMSVQTLLSNKLRSSLTMLGIVIGNASVIALVGVGEGTQNLATEQFASLGTNVLFVVPETSDAWGVTNQRPRTLVLADALAIANQVPAVKAVAPEIQSLELASYGNRNVQTRVIGTTPEYISVRSFDVAQGQFFRDLDLKRNGRVVVLGPDLAAKLFKHQNPIGERVRIKNLSFLVIGVMQPKGSVLGTNLDDVAMIPITTLAHQIIGRTSPYGIQLSFISLSAQDETRVKAAQFQVENLLRNRRNSTRTNGFMVQSQKDLLKTANQVTGAITLMLAAIASISLLVGGIGIMNIMLISVSERTPEIGLRKAIGATSQDILMQFLIESVILSVTGGIVGILTGISGNLLIAAFTPLQVRNSAIAITLATCVSGGIGLFFGVFPARQAAKLDSIVALRNS